MELAELQKLAKRTRATRESGIALILAAVVLGLFYFVPLKPSAPTKNVTAVTDPNIASAYSQLSVEAKAAIVYDLATNKVLYAKNENAQLPLASLTKLLTVYAALAELSPQTPVTIPSDATQLTPPRAFAPGETLAFGDLARLTLTASLNDGATAIAEAAAAHTGGSTSTLLASAASGLNLAQTYAVNGSGLDINTVVSGGYGSAHDVAILAGALVQKAPDIALATTESIAKAKSARGTSYEVKNTDPIVESVPGLLLSKTGYTDLAGGNLALVFDVGIGHPVAVVVLGSSKESRFTDGQTLAAATLAYFAGRSSL